MYFLHLFKQGNIVSQQLLRIYEGALFSFRLAGLGLEVRLETILKCRFVDATVITLEIGVAEGPWESISGIDKMASTHSEHAGYVS